MLGLVHARSQFCSVLLIWYVCFSNIIEITAHLLCTSAALIFASTVSVLLSNMIPTLVWWKVIMSVFKTENQSLPSW